MKTVAPSLAILAAALSFSSLAFAGFASTETFLPAVGRVTGQGGAQFYTTIWATNLTGVTVSFTFDFLKQGQANPSPASFSDTLAPGQTKVYENIVETKLGLSGQLGAARITASGEILVSERIYNQAPGDDVGKSEGLFFAGVPRSLSISLGQSASIQGINQGGSESFRYNFALVETGGGSPTVNVQLFDGNATMLGQKAYNLQPYEQVQPNVADLFSGIATTNARITATVTGGSGSALIAGAQLANESQDSSGFEMSFRDSILGGGTGVTSLNSLTGALNLTAGTGITITPSGNTIMVAATAGSGGILTLPYSQMVADADHPGFAITNTATAPSGGANSAITGIGGVPSGFAGGQFSNGTTGVTGDSKTGTGVVGSSLGSVGVLGASGGIAGVLGVVFTESPGTVGYGVAGLSSSSKSTGVFGQQGLTGPDVSNDIAGVEGSSSDQAGVIGRSATNNGVQGFSDAGGIGGVIGNNDSSSGWGAEGYNTATNGHGYLGGYEYGVLGVAPMFIDRAVYAGSFQGDVTVTGHLSAHGVTLAVSPDPIRPEMEIRYVSLEGREAGTYFRGTARIVNGFATIEVPEDFRMVTTEKGLTVVVTPVGGLAVLAAIHQGLDKIVIQGSADVDFNYMVNGVRKGSEDFAPVARNEDFVPRSAEDKEFARHLDANAIAALKANGILNADGSINLKTAHRLGWDRKPGWSGAKPESNAKIQ